jgi:hypothetical protein
LNVRIQKSLIIDFDLQGAQDSAIEDWKIDVEREKADVDANFPEVNRGKIAKKESTSEIEGEEQS